MGTNAETQPDSVQRVRDLGTLSPEWEVSIKSLPSGLRELEHIIKQWLYARPCGICVNTYDT